MGNWRTVRIIGTMPADQVDALQRALCIDWRAIGEEWPEFKPLCYSRIPSVFGVGAWPAAKINAFGNLSERDFSVQAIADHAGELLAIAPGLAIKIHCGGEWETRECVATITVDQNGAQVGRPEISELPEFTEADIKRRTQSAILAAWQDPPPGPDDIVLTVTLFARPSPPETDPEGNPHPGAGDRTERA